MGPAENQDFSRGPRFFWPPILRPKKSRAPRKGKIFCKDPFWNLQTAPFCDLVGSISQNKPGSQHRRIGILMQPVSTIFVGFFFRFLVFLIPHPSHFLIYRTVSWDFFGSIFLKSVHSGPIRDIFGPFWFVWCFHQVTELVNQLPGTLETGNHGYLVSKAPGSRFKIHITLWKSEIKQNGPGTSPIGPEQTNHANPGGFACKYTWNCGGTWGRGRAGWWDKCNISLHPVQFPFILPVTCSMLPASSTVPWPPSCTLFHVPCILLCSLTSFPYSVPCYLHSVLFPVILPIPCSMFPAFCTVPCPTSCTLFHVPCIQYCFLASFRYSVPCSLHPALFPGDLNVLCSMFSAFCTYCSLPSLPYYVPCSLNPTLFTGIFSLPCTLFLACFLACMQDLCSRHIWICFILHVCKICVAGMLGTVFADMYARFA